MEILTFIKVETRDRVGFNAALKGGGDATLLTFHQGLAPTKGIPRKKTSFYPEILYLIKK